MDFLGDRLAWYLLGPCLGLLVATFVIVLNARLGVMGGWSNVVDRVSGREQGISWKGWFAIGVLGGGALFHLLAGETTTGSGYGWLTRELSSPAAVCAVLAFAGALIGYGAKVAGGCTSGNGIGGSSFGSPASLAATATFMATAVGASLAIGAIT